MHWVITSTITLDGILESLNLPLIVVRESRNENAVQFHLLCKKCCTKLADYNRVAT